MHRNCRIFVGSVLQPGQYDGRTRACLTAHEGNHIISEAITTIAR